MWEFVRKGVKRCDMQDAFFLGRLLHFAAILYAMPAGAQIWYHGTKRLVSTPQRCSAGASCPFNPLHIVVGLKLRNKVP